MIRIVTGAVVALALGVGLPAPAAAPRAGHAAAAEPANPSPPGGGRPVAFDVRTGTNFAVAVSPDCKRLAFDLQGSIWIVPASGGRARRITDYFSDAHLPTWSPDGSRLVYYAFRGGSYKLWSVGPDGRHPRQLTRGDLDDRDPAWSPDGRTIAFASERGGGYHIWTLDLATGRLTQLTYGAGEDRSPAWSADGAAIVYASRQAGSSAIWSVPAGGGGEPRLLRRAPAGTSFEAPALSAKGALSLIAQDAAGSRLEVNGAPVSGSENVFAFRASWSGEAAYYVSDGLIRRRSPAGLKTIPFIARLQATRPVYTRVSRDFSSTAPRKVLGIQHPVLSPDGTRIAFVALGDLYLVSAHGGKPEQLTRDNALEADPAWSPDGKTLAYTSDKGGGLPQLWLRDLATGKDRRLTDIATQPLAAAWSPDGTRIAFLDYDGLFGAAGLELVDVATGVVTRLQPSLAEPGKPAWSADGRYVAVALARPYSASFREGSNQIWVVPANGRDAPFWREADGSSLDIRGGGGPVWSPDGQRMAAIQDGLLKVWPVSPDGRALAAPRAYTSEISYYPSWSGDSKAVLYQAGDKLKIVDLATAVSREVPLDFTYRLAVPTTRIVVHVGGLVDAVHDVTQVDRDLVIQGNRIAAILPHDPRNYHGADQVIEAPGLTAIPGLIDHHTHPEKDFGANAHLAWLAYGVTTLRDPGNQPYDGVEDREASEAGVRIGPRIYTTGPLLEWRRTYYRMGVAISGPAHLEREIARAAALKYDLIKSYVRMPDLQQRRLVEAAHAMGIPVASHEIFPAAFTGVDNTEHLGASSRRGFSPKQGPQGRVYDDVIQLFGQSRRTLTPTVFGALNIYLASHPQWRSDPRLALYPEWASKLVTQDQPLPPALLAMQPGQLAGLKAIRDAGALIAAGTDMVVAPNLQGELIAYVNAGFTPFEALQSATANPARALNLDAGTLEPGRLADIVLVEGDPRRDISVLLNVRQVIANGIPHTVEDLLALAQHR